MVCRLLADHHDRLRHMARSKASVLLDSRRESSLRNVIAFLRRILSLCSYILAETDTVQVRQPAKPKVKLSELWRVKRE